MSGDIARKAFYNAPGLDSLEGYRLLTGGSPKLSDLDVRGPDQHNLTFFGKHLNNLLRRERVEEILPVLFDDVQRLMEDWGKEGTLNPFKEVYDLVFQMTVRIGSCRELADDKETIAKIAKNYWALEKSATPFSLLFPWLPCPAKWNRLKATLGLFTTLSGIVKRRREAEEPTSDAIDVLIAAGESNNAIVGFVLGVIFAGVINTGVNVCWNLIYLGIHPEWKEKVIAEVNTLLANHGDISLTGLPLHKRLASIPLSAWEDEMPILDAVIRETLRITSAGTALRRNIGKDMDVDESMIQRGEFMAYSMADVHHNPDIYPNPLSFDPERYNEGRAEDKKGLFSYLGWGAGMRIAKLEIKLTLALLLTGYDFEIVDASGHPTSTLVQPNKNDIHQARPVGEPCFMKFRRVVN
ncbi:hypothetical protein H0H92_002462 [Tricholoma furcatifolium]|nr:hypothetical protein H0H92_002462 [Tricholoma furcatifolium]